nr:immunoglobulin heavy chain junction region [Mus musculus]MBK4187796.1 immunoglobulin heavy chain junction region [Mus musculus]MBK4187797.1 immunoglobulin heavy chain junction region [Mus musculus]MBK4187807.1 immunoglobulin heavy chain junction region [Mus musculus]MBK4187808.1 immunoglobulin heavy chain junction region [Mus musculus]
CALYYHVSTYWYFDVW